MRQMSMASKIIFMLDSFDGPYGGTETQFWHLLNLLDRERFEHVAERLDRQLENAEEWRDVCTRYFRQFFPEPA